ncbi:MAG: hypothetical protein A3F16_07065 [Deltaproteobacteria bacterium RIFCSPHIGHO2_12_FULL_43_9]|nr:MAG: hypothetical protein A3F16_07065 [Deltaproteobacteria bacterium RIFCSPHIGHO2_12_FULL_43_9]
MNKRAKTVFFISTGAIALIAISIALSLSSITRPSKVARRFLEDLSKRKLEAAYSMTSAQFRATVTKETFRDFLTLYPVLTSKSEINFSGHTAESNITTISGDIKGIDGSITPITMHVIKEKGDWRILALSLNPAETNRALSSEEEKQ